MTRKSERELEREIERLEPEGDEDVDPIFVLPKRLVDSWGEDYGMRTDLPDGVAIEDIEVPVETGGGEVVRKATRPLCNPDATPDRIIISEVDYAHLWADLSPDERERERTLREQRDLPIPSILEPDAAD